MKRVVLAVLTVVASFSATMAQAGQWYVRGDAGYGWSRDAEIKDKGDCSAGGALVGCDKVTGDFGNGFAVGLGVGKQILPWLRTEAAVTYRGAYAYEVEGVSARQDLDAWTGMANVYLDVRGLTKTRMGVFHPYVGAGIGVSRNESGKLKDKDNGGAFAPGGEYTTFAWSLTAGSGIMVLKDKLVFDLAYRYSDLGKAGGESGPAFDGIGSYQASPTEVRVRLHEITAGLRYMF
jgi:Opacity protein and related surface antigens